MKQILIKYKWSLLIVLVVFLTAGSVLAYSSGSFSLTDIAESLALTSSESSTNNSAGSSTNIDTLRELLPDPIYEDPRTGMVFPIPDGFTLTEMDDYFILSHPDYEDGSILVFLQNEYEFTDKYQVYMITMDWKKTSFEFMLDSELTYFDLVEHNRTGSWVMNRSTRAGYTAESTIYCGTELLKSKFYCFATDLKGASIGWIARDDSDQKSFFDEQVQMMVQYTYSVSLEEPLNPHDMIYEYEFRDEKLGNLTYQIPSEWQTYTISDSAKLYRPYPAYGEVMNGVNILVLYPESNNQLEELNELSQFLKYRKHSEVYANMVSMNPETDTTLTFSTTVASEGCAQTEFNGRTYLRGYYNSEVLKNGSSMLEDVELQRKISTIIYSSYDSKGEYYEVVLYRILNRNDIYAENLAEMILSSLN